MRINLALLDWNENVNRGYTSVNKTRDLRRPDHRTAMKVLVKKTFKFVDLLWAMFVVQNQVDSSELEDDVEGSDKDDENEEEFEDGLLLLSESSDSSDDSEDDN